MILNRTKNVNLKRLWPYSNAIMRFAIKKRARKGSNENEGVHDHEVRTFDTRVEQTKTYETPIYIGHAQYLAPGVTRRCPRVEQRAIRR